MDDEMNIEEDYVDSDAVREDLVDNDEMDSTEEGMSKGFYDEQSGEPKAQEDDEKLAEE